MKYVKCYEKEVPSALIKMANGVLKTIKHPAAAILGKVTTTVDEVLAKFPGSHYRFVIEAVQDETEDREASEEREITAEQVR
jgi:predicted thioesterase